MPILVKICGLTTPDTLDVALDAGADMVGFVFFPPSPRHLDIAGARDLFRRARGHAVVAALMVDPEQTLVDEVVGELAPDLIQLHGREGPERVAWIKATCGSARVMKAIGVAAPADLAAARSYAGVADMLILDAKAQPDASRPGGNGVAFDWSLIGSTDVKTPYLLSGGLTPDNVADAIRALRGRYAFTGVDVSSGVEQEPGIKDVGKIRDFIAAVRAADAGQDLSEQDRNVMVTSA